MDENLISVIMPAYNAEKFIADAIQSVVNQSYKNWELIIVDDGSTDNTAKIIKDFAALHNQIKYFYQENGRQGKARNLGIKNSTGSYIAFLDADDLWVAEKLHVQINKFQSSKNIDLIFCNGYQLIEQEVRNFDVTIKSIWNSANFINFVAHNQIPILSVLVKKKALLKAGGFSEKIEIQNTEDYHLWLKMLLNNSCFQSIEDRLFYYRIHPNQVTYENKDTAKPIFNTLIDIYDFTNKSSEKKIIIEKIKWYIFNPNDYEKSLFLIVKHFKQSKKSIINFFIKTFLTGKSKVQKKLIFKLVTLFG